MQSVIHAEKSAEQFGGRSEDYLDIHKFLDSSKAFINDARHRTLTHNSWFIREVLPMIFGETRVNSDGKKYSVVAVGEQHVVEDYNMLFVPTPQDFLSQMELTDWMDNARGDSLPPSCVNVKEKKRVEPATQERVKIPKDFEPSGGGRHGAIRKGLID